MNSPDGVMSSHSLVLVAGACHPESADVTPLSSRRSADDVVAAVSVFHGQAVQATDDGKREKTGYTALICTLQMSDIPSND